MKKNFLLIGCALLFSSCLYFTKKKYRINESFYFQSRSQYLDYLYEKKLFDKEQILFLDEENYIRFINEQTDNSRQLIYLGCYLNDSISFSIDQPLLQNPSCASQIEFEFTRSMYSGHMSLSKVVKSRKISSYNLHHLSDGRQFDFQDNAGKKCLFLAYSYSLGQYYDKLYNNLINIQKKQTDATSLYVISLDPVYRLR